MADDLREERDRYRRLWLAAADDRDRLSEALTELSEQLERMRDIAAAAWAAAADWQEWQEADEIALEEERAARAALVREEVNRLTGREPKRRGPAPAWTPDGEAEVERLHRDGASIRRIAADLGVSKSKVQRVIARVRRQHDEARERARLTAIANGRSPAQRTARVAKLAAERHPIPDYDPSRAERGRKYLCGVYGVKEDG